MLFSPHPHPPAASTTTTRVLLSRAVPALHFRNTAVSSVRPQKSYGRVLFGSNGETDGRTDGRRRCIVHAPADPKRTYIFICECCKTLVPIGRRDDWIPGTTGQNDFAGSLSIIPVVEGFSDISRVYIGCTIRTRASRCRSKYRRYAFTCRVLFFRP